MQLKLGVNQQSCELNNQLKIVSCRYSEQHNGKLSNWTWEGTREVHYSNGRKLLASKTSRLYPLYAWNRVQHLPGQIKICDVPCLFGGEEHLWHGGFLSHGSNRIFPCKPSILASPHMPILRIFRTSGHNQHIPPQVPQVPHHAISNKAVAVANLKIFQRPPALGKKLTKRKGLREIESLRMFRGWNQPNILKDLEDSRSMVIDGLAGLEWDPKHDQIQHKISEPGGSKSLRMGDFPWSWLITGTGIVGDAVNMVYKMILNAQVTTFWWLDTKWCNLVWFLDFRYLSFYNPFIQYQNISNTSHKPWFREWNQVFETIPWECFSGWGREKASSFFHLRHHPSSTRPWPSRTSCWWVFPSPCLAAMATFPCPPPIVASWSFHEEAARGDITWFNRYL